MENTLISQDDYLNFLNRKIEIDKKISYFKFDIAKQISKCYVIYKKEKNKDIDFINMDIHIRVNDEEEVYLTKMKFDKHPTLDEQVLYIDDTNGSTHRLTSLSVEVLTTIITIFSLMNV